VNCTACTRRARPFELARHGIDFSVATLGTATTADHLNRLFRLTENIDFCFDGDRAGKQAAWRALETALPHIREGRQVRFVFLPDGQDPDSYVNARGADAFIKALDEGVALSDYLIAEIAQQVDLGTVDGRARLAELAKPLVARIPQGVYRELLIESLAQTVGLTSSKLEKMLGRTQAAGHDRPARKRRLRGPSLSGAAGRPSVVRRAITLLLNHPDAAAGLDVEKIAGLSRPGIDLLRDLIETAQQEPNITTAGLLERWRHDEQGRHLGKLAAIEVPGDEEFDPAAELADCVEQLALAGRRERIDFLIEKQRVKPLDESEMAELRQLR
jgi:DNA primase